MQSLLFLLRFSFASLCVNRSTKTCHCDETCVAELTGKSSFVEDDAKKVKILGGYKVQLIWLSYAIRFKLLRHCIFSASVGEAGGPPKTRVCIFVGQLLRIM